VGHPFIPPNKAKYFEMGGGRSIPGAWQLQSSDSESFSDSEFDAESEVPGPGRYPIRIQISKGHQPGAAADIGTVQPACDQALMAWN
jgi:hypothetical protein